jgi:hypothetical protein
MVWMGIATSVVYIGKSLILMICKRLTSREWFRDDYTQRYRRVIETFHVAPDGATDLVLALLCQALEDGD